MVEAIALSGIAAIFIAVALYSAATPFPGIAAALPCFGALALLWWASNADGRSAILSSPVPVAIGLVSYSLYLLALADHRLFSFDPPVRWTFLTRRLRLR